MKSKEEDREENQFQVFIRYDLLKEDYHNLSSKRELKDKLSLLLKNRYLHIFLILLLIPSFTNVKLNIPMPPETMIGADDVADVCSGCARCVILEQQLEELRDIVYELRKEQKVLQIGLANCLNKK